MSREHRALHSVPASSPRSASPGGSLCSQPTARGPPPRNPPCPPQPLATDSARSPALRGAPTAHRGWRTPAGGGGGGPPSSPSLFANQDTDSLFNFTMEGWDEGGRGVPPPCPGCVEVVQSHCRALYVLDYCYILYIFLFFCCCCCLFLFFFSVYICGIFRDSYTS